MLKGIKTARPGYTGGIKASPAYEEVCSGKTGHAEVIRIGFDPSQITYKDLLTVFFATHDPTTLNRQGNDVGTQYRSIVLYASEEQRREAENFIKELNCSRSQPVITEVKPLGEFYEAEEYHRKYYENNSYQPYCQLIINPKLQKVYKQFTELLKSHSRTR